MNTTEIVLYQDERQGSGEVVTVQQMLQRAASKRHAGPRKMAQLAAHPENAPAILMDEPEDGRCVALLFCGKVMEHLNGKKYVMALRREGSDRLVAEKYWLADPLPSTFYAAILN